MPPFLAKKKQAWVYRIVKIMAQNSAVLPLHLLVIFTVVILAYTQCGGKSNKTLIVDV